MLRVVNIQGICGKFNSNRGQDEEIIVSEVITSLTCLLIFWHILRNEGGYNYKQWNA
jgi:hypothetical protein